MAAAAGGDVAAVMSMLAPDVAWTADSGGKASAARRPVIGADKVAGLIVGLIGRGMQLPDVRVEMVVCNAAPAVLLYARDQLEGVFTVEIVDGKITNFYAMRNPDKLVGRHDRTQNQPRLTFSAKLGACESTDSAIWAAPMRCCAPSATPRTGWICRRRPR